MNLAKSYKLPQIIDDAVENKVQPISWYVQELHRVPALLAQFSSTSRKGHEVHNAKCAFVSGMALGLEIKVKMIAEIPYETPLDYKELLERFTNRAECMHIVRPFFEDVQKNIGELFVKTKSLKEKRNKRSELQKINFGEAIAEHENLNLYEYYVESANTHTLVKKEYNIVVGRKGTGKTATLYYLDNILREDKRNHVVIIKPITFEVDGLISLMEATNNDFERGYLVECIWKFLIYSEIGKYLYQEIKDKPKYAITNIENKFLEYVAQRESIFLTDFSTRLEEQIKILKEKNISGLDAGNNEFRLKVSEYLHQGILSEAKEFYAKIIPKNHRLIVLIDNLDKSWRPNSKINILSKYILGLLGVSGRIVQELSVIKSLQTNISFHLTLFLRSDIFKYVTLFAREPDKLEITRLQWDDKELLFRIIEERFVELSDENFEAKDLWDKFVVSEVENIPVRDFIMNAIFPRPRDIIYFMKAARDRAVSRAHHIIEADDIKGAYNEYSAWFFQSLIVENGITLKQMEDFMYELMASTIILEKAEIVKKMERASIDVSTEDAIDKFIDHLADLSIIGRETSFGVFKFEYDVDRTKKIKILSEKFNSHRFRIHNALLPYLECVS